MREARELLQGLPIAMSYNLTMVDVEGRTGTAFVAPARRWSSPTRRSRRTIAAAPEYPARANALRSVPRLNRLTQLVSAHPDPDALAGEFLAEPLYNRNYSGAFGTLYTVQYRPVEQVARYLWPNLTWCRGFGDGDDTRTVVLAGT